MTRSARPNNWQDLLAGYVLDDLSPEEAEALQQLLADHPELAVEVDCLQEVLTLLPYGVPEQEPPTHLKQVILTAAQTSPHPLPVSLPLSELPQTELPQIELPQSPRTEQASTRPAQPRRRTPWLGVGGAIAAATLLALGLDNYRLRQEVIASRQEVDAIRQEVEASRPILAALQQPDAVLYGLEGTENAAQASGSIVVTPNQQILIVAQNLPELPPDRIYRLWAMAKNVKQPAYCGQFNASSTGEVSTLWQNSTAQCSRNPTQLLITAERLADPPVPQGTLVMKSQG